MYLLYIDVNVRHTFGFPRCKDGVALARRRYSGSETSVRGERAALCHQLLKRARVRARDTRERTRVVE